MTAPSNTAKSGSKSGSAPDSFFTATLAEADPEIADAIKGELGRQRHEIELIASENIVSRAVLEAQGSVMTNKYAEGYPGARYYGGCEWVDVAETLAIERAKKLFGAKFANVQPNSCSPATPSWASTSPPAAISPTARPSTCPANGSRRCTTRCGARTSLSTWMRWPGRPNRSSRS
jgi:hypothetical protein